jgi:hypothetical protein
MQTILPYTFFDRVSHLSSLYTPSYVRMNIQSTRERIVDTLPGHLHGSNGLINMIYDFIGLDGYWVKVDADIARMGGERHNTIFFLFNVLSRIDPVPTTLHIPNQLPIVRRPRHSCELASEQIPYIFNHDGTICRYYRTRTGHIGTESELKGVTSSIVFHGALSYDRPNQQDIHGRCLVVVADKTKDTYWKQSNSLQVIDSSQSHLGDVHYDTIILDNVYAFVSTLSKDQLHPSFELRGMIYPTSLSWITRLNCNNIIQVCSKTPSVHDVITCLYTLNTERNGCKLVYVNERHEYQVNRQYLIRTMENLFA